MRIGLSCFVRMLRGVIRLLIRAGSMGLLVLLIKHLL